jgi:hypothetical protein
MNRILAPCWLVVLLASPAWAERLGSHEIRTDAQGQIVPWFSPDVGRSYDHVIGLVWNYWKNMPRCPNGVPYYLQHMVRTSPNCYPNGIGADQVAEALSSWQLLYQYSGDPAVLENMVLIADYYLDHGLSPADAAWPNLPYPYNTDVHSGRFDGDMMAGKGYLMPDKAGSFGAELMTLYKIKGTPKYLDAAVRIADTLAAKAVPGNDNESPWPFRVDAITGKLPPANVSATYTANWVGTMRLFDDLIAMGRGNVAGYQKTREMAVWWLKHYAMKLNKWGPFFEDYPGWSDAEINADTLAWYILEHPQWGPRATRDARAILDWTTEAFGNDRWAKYGVTAIGEQTNFMNPGNSHTVRHASLELLYCAKTGDAATKAAAIRKLNWATYMVDEAGENRYPDSDNVLWITDGYGDYVRHYLRAMAAAPELAPAGQNHLLGATSVIRQIAYTPESLTYTTFDNSGRETLRIAFTPKSVTADDAPLARLAGIADLERQPGYTFEAAGDAPGVLRIRHDRANRVVIVK